MIPVSEVNMSSRKITPKKLKVREQLEAMKNDLEGSKDRRLQEECEKAEYRPPCQGEQVGENKNKNCIRPPPEIHSNILYNFGALPFSKKKEKKKKSLIVHVT